MPTPNDLFLDTGKSLTTAALLAQNTVKYVAWGTGAGSALTSTATALVAAAAPTATTAVTGTPTQQTTTVTNDTYQVVGVVTAGGALAITEVIVLNQATVSGATAYQYGFFATMNVAANDTITFTMKVKYA